MVYAHKGHSVQEWPFVILYVLQTEAYYTRGSKISDQPASDTAYKFS